MSATRLAVLFMLLGVVTTGCATTRVVKTQPGKGGEIAVHDGIFGDARAEAKQKMKSNCNGKKVDVTEEGEAVVGKTTHSNKNKTSYGSSSDSDTEDKREWRIKYKCVSKKA